MKERKIISLKVKLTSVITLLLGAISIFVYVYFPQKFKQERYKSLNEKANSIAKITAYGVSSGVYFDDYEATFEEIEALIKTEAIRYVIIIKGDSLYFNYNKATADSCQYKNFSSTYIDEKMEIMKSHAPVIISNEKIADLYIGYSLHLVNTKIEELKSKIGLVSIALFIVGSFIVYLIGVYFTKPLSAMFDTVNKISQGDLKQRANIHSNDEVGYLAEAFNKMVDKIEETNIEMEIINEGLEKRVQDRTIELEGALDSLQKALDSLKKENEVRKKAEQEISESLKEKEVMLKEIHHRVKNNLQIVSSLLFFQSKKISDRQTLEIFRDGENRVKSMALIHEKLYQAEDLANIDFKEYVKNLATFLFQSYGIDRTKFNLKNNVKDVKLDIDTAVPCGLIINELITNSFKHGFKGKDSGKIVIDMHHDENDKLFLKVSDNGIGIPKGLDIKKVDSLGLRLVENLTIQLCGNIKYYNNNGTTVEIVFKEIRYRKVV